MVHGSVVVDSDRVVSVLGVWLVEKTVDSKIVASVRVVYDVMEELEVVDEMVLLVVVLSGVSVLGVSVLWWLVELSITVVPDAELALVLKILLALDVVLDG